MEDLWCCSCFSPHHTRPILCMSLDGGPVHNSWLYRQWQWRCCIIQIWFCKIAAFVETYSLKQKQSAGRQRSWETAVGNYKCKSQEVVVPERPLQEYPSLVLTRKMFPYSRPQLSPQLGTPTNPLWTARTKFCHVQWNYCTSSYTDAPFPVNIIPIHWQKWDRWLLQAWWPEKASSHHPS